MEQTNLIDSQKSALPRLLVLASTFPRWENDTEPAFIFELSRRLTSHFDVHLLAPHADGASQYEVMSGIKVHRFRYAPGNYQTLSYDGGILSRLRQNKWRATLIPIFIASETIAIRRLLKRYNFDVVHSHWIIPQTFALRLALIGLVNKPTVLCTSHGGDLFALQGYLMSTVKRWALRCCSGITVVSSAMIPEAKRLAAHLSPQVIPMGTCLSKQFTLDNKVEREERMVLFVGRLVEKKGTVYLLNAIAKLIPEYPELRLCIAGKGPEEEALKNRSAQQDLSGHVMFIGAINHKQLPDLYRKASVTVVPSIIAKSGDQEGFGLVIIEAMGCGSPVIVSDLPAIRDTVPLEGLALKVKPADTDALAKAISIILDKPEEAMQRSIAAHTYVRTTFDWEIITEKYRTELLRLIE